MQDIEDLIYKVECVRYKMTMQKVPDQIMYTILAVRSVFNVSLWVPMAHHAQQINPKEPTGTP